VNHYPAEDEKLRASTLVRRRGGNCPNTLEVLQQLLDFSNSLVPISLILSAVLPSISSDGTQQIKASFGPAVDLTHCVYREEFNEPASSYIIKSRSTDSRTIVNYNELPEMTSKELIAVANELGDAACWFHFEASPTPSLRSFEVLPLTISRDEYRKSL
jgi:ketohexokinase